jgi:hypothetical protein
LIEAERLNLIVEDGDCMKLRWVKSEPHFHWGALAARGVVAVRMVVEATPGGQWDWVAWQGLGSQGRRSGIAPSATAATAAAEAAARELHQATTA